jgi:hypothetical protein
MAIPKFSPPGLDANLKSKVVIVAWSPVAKNEAAENSPREIRAIKARTFLQAGAISGSSIKRKR